MLLFPDRWCKYFFFSDVHSSLFIINIVYYFRANLQLLYCMYVLSKAPSKHCTSWIKYLFWFCQLFFVHRIWHFLELNKDIHRVHGPHRPQMEPNLLMDLSWSILANDLWRDNLGKLWYYTRRKSQTLENPEPKKKTFSMLVVTGTDSCIFNVEWLKDLLPLSLIWL